MTEAYLDDDGDSEVAAVEAVPEGVDVKPGAILVRVGHVFYDSTQPVEEPGVWVGYQPAYRHSRPEGPVLLTPALWRELNDAVEQRLAEWEDRRLARKYGGGGGCER